MRYAPERTSGWGALALATVVVVASGCGGDDDTKARPPSSTSGTSSTGTGGAGVGGTGGGTAGGDSVTFIVVDSLYGDTSFPPLPGATVAFDAPGGERVEAVSGDDGKVTFTGIDWSKGKAAATAHLDGYAMFSLVDLDEATLAAARRVDDAVALLVYDPTPAAPETVTVSGKVTGLLDGSHSLIVQVVEATSTWNAGTAWTGSAAGTFNVSVPKGKPFTLQAWELTPGKVLPSGQGYDQSIHQVMNQSFAPADANLAGTVLDFAATPDPKLATQSQDVSAATPARADSPVRAGLGVGLVCPTNVWYCSGWATHIDVAADKSRFDATLEWAEPTWVSDPITFVRVYPDKTALTTASEVISFRRASGWPKPGSIGTLPDTPAWVTPADASTPHPLHDALAWKLFDTEVPHLRLRIQRGQTIVWMIEAGPDATSLTVPQPPSSVDAGKELGASPLKAWISELWMDEANYEVEASSLSEAIELTP